MLVVEDAQQDVRFINNKYVAGKPGIRFYAGAPLVGSTGQRYGTLCCIDFKPRRFTADQYMLLCHFAELATRELERDRLLQQGHTDLRAALNGAAVPSGHVLFRGMDALDESVMLTDLSQCDWPIVYCNEAWAKSTGIDISSSSSSLSTTTTTNTKTSAKTTRVPPFWQLFGGRAVHAGEVATAMGAAQTGQSFTLTVRSTIQDGHVVTLRFKPVREPGRLGAAAMPLVAIPPVGLEWMDDDAARAAELNEVEASQFGRPTHHHDDPVALNLQDSQRAALAAALGVVSGQPRDPSLLHQSDLTAIESAAAAATAIADTVEEKKAAQRAKQAANSEPLYYLVAILRQGPELPPPRQFPVSPFAAAVPSLSTTTPTTTTTTTGVGAALSPSLPSPSSSPPPSSPSSSHPSLSAPALEINSSGHVDTIAEVPAPPPTATVPPLAPISSNSVLNRQNDEHHRNDGDGGNDASSSPASSSSPEVVQQPPPPPPPISVSLPSPATALEQVAAALACTQQHHTGLNVWDSVDSQDLSRLTGVAATDAAAAAAAAAGNNNNNNNNNNSGAVKSMSALSSSSAWGLTDKPPAALNGLVLGPLAGCSRRGRCYRGTWKGERVAVKVRDIFEDCPRDSTHTQDTISTLLQHQGSTTTTTTTTTTITSTSMAALPVHQNLVPVRASAVMTAPSGLPHRTHLQVWVVEEFCNRGSLSDAIKVGGLFWKTATTDNGVDISGNNNNNRQGLIKYLKTALEIARGGAALHAAGMVHGQLTCSSVLLVSQNRQSLEQKDGAVAVDGGSSEQKQQHHEQLQLKWKAMVGDYALMGGRQPQNTPKHDQAGHLPPEVMMGDAVTSATDAYSFGVLLWEMWQGEKAWKDLRALAIVRAVALEKRRLPLPKVGSSATEHGAPAGLVDLMRRCLSDVVEERPCFDAIVEELDVLLLEATSFAVTMYTT